MQLIHYHRQSDRETAAEAISTLEELIDSYLNFVNKAYDEAPFGDAQYIEDAQDDLLSLKDNLRFLANSMGINLEE